MKTLDLSDHRALRTYLTADDYALHEGQEYEPKGNISKETWQSVTGLPDNAALQTTDYYSRAIEVLNKITQSWLDIHDRVPEGTPIRTQCLAAYDGFKGSLFNAVHGWYRIAGITLRCAFEDILLGMYFQHQKGQWAAFEAVVTGKGRSPRRQAIDAELVKYVPQAALDRANALYQDELSIYVHRISEGEIWESNGPIFHHEALERWIEQFDRAFRSLCEMIDCVVPSAGAMQIANANAMRLKTTVELLAEQDRERRNA